MSERSDFDPSKLETHYVARAIWYGSLKICQAERRGDINSKWVINDMSRIGWSIEETLVLQDRCNAAAADI